MEFGTDKFRVIVMNVLRDAHRQEIKLGFTNNSKISANCDFHLQKGVYDEMFAFSVLPFRALIKPGVSFTITLTIRPDVSSYNKEEADQREEMRKFLNIKLIDTKINIIVPIIFKFIHKKKDEAD